MNKTQLVKLISEETGIMAGDVAQILNQFITDIRRLTKEGETIKIRNFGNFAAIERSARKYRHPQSGKIVSIPEKRRFCFKPSFKIKLL